MNSKGNKFGLNELKKFFEQFDEKSKEDFDFLLLLTRATKVFANVVDIPFVVLEEVKIEIKILKREIKQLRQEQEKEKRVSSVKKEKLRKDARELIKSAEIRSESESKKIRKKADLLFKKSKRIRPLAENNIKKISEILIEKNEKHIFLSTIVFALKNS